MKKLIIATAALLTISLCTHAQQKPPVTVDDYATASAGMPISVNVLKNDYGMLGHRLKIFHAINGQVTHNDSLIFYTPPLSFSGEKMIKYILIDEDNGLYSEPGYLWVSVDNQSYSLLNTNNIEARINSNGIHFYIPDEYAGSHFIVPKGSGKSTFLSFSLWIGGLDSNNVLHFAGDKYQNSGMDFFPGPVSDNYDTSYQRKWNKVWEIKKADIEYHKNNWWKENYNPATIISTWPAHGDLYKRSFEMIAPFEDVNSNGTYDPLEGDYPLIKGDQAIFFVVNDDRLNHTGSYGNKLGIEVHGMAYSYDCPHDSALNNTIFFHYRIKNRSTQTYYNTHIGFYADMNIGFQNDDYMQTDVIRNSLIGMNGDNIDGEGYTGNAYGHHPPAQSLTILKGPSIDADGTDNPGNDTWGNPLPDQSFNGMYFGDGIIDNECLGISYSSVFKEFTGPTSDPYSAYDYYKTMQAMWKDNSRFQYGKDGHTTSGAEGPDCRFMYPGNSDDINFGTSGIAPNGGYNSNGYFWTENTAGNTPGDRRGNISMGPITLQPGDIQEIDLAMVFARDYINPGCTAPLSILEDRIDLIREYYFKDSIPQNNAYGIEGQQQLTEIEIWSVNNRLAIHNPDNYTGNIGIYNLQGKAILQSSLNGDSKQQISFNAPAGYYVVNIVGREFSVSRKVFVY